MVLVAGRARRVIATGHKIDEGPLTHELLRPPEHLPLANAPSEFASGEFTSHGAIPVSAVMPARSQYSRASAWRAAPRGRRPGRMSIDSALTSWM